MAAEPAKSSGRRLVKLASRMRRTSTAKQLLIVMNLLLLTSWTMELVVPAGYGYLLPYAEAVSVQKLNVPDLVVIDQLNQQQTKSSSAPAATQDQLFRTGGGGVGGNTASNSNSQPEAASLINSQELTGEQQQSQITFECLISFDKRKDRNLIVKWHHDDRIEPIYQWIPELNKRSIAPQYRAFIAPIVTTASSQQLDANQQAAAASSGSGGSGISGLNQNATSNQVQLLEAGFRLVRLSKELGGKYTCSAISTQNDDSKWKKMIVYTPPRVFRFNASRTDIGALLASQRERLIQPSMIGSVVSSMPTSSNFQLPLAYRMRGFDQQQHQVGQPMATTTTISPQMYSTIDYVNVNQQRTRQSLSSSWVLGPPTPSPHPAQTSVDIHRLGSAYSSSGSGISQSSKQNKQMNGVKLVCDIDQVFPVPEVSIYKLAKLDGSHPDKLSKLDTRIERNPVTGLYHVQVISILDDDELQMKYGFNEPVYFECLIALTNLELSKYADNKRSIVYRPGHLTNSSLAVQTSEDITNLEQVGSSASRSGTSNHQNSLLFCLNLVLSFCWFTCFSKAIRHHQLNLFAQVAVISPIATAS